MCGCAAESIKRRGYAFADLAKRHSFLKKECDRLLVGRIEYRWSRAAGTTRFESKTQCRKIG